LFLSKFLGVIRVLHIFTDILTIIVLGTLCCCDDTEKLDEWTDKEESWLSTFL